MRRSAPSTACTLLHGCNCLRGKRTPGFSGHRPTHALVPQFAGMRGLSKVVLRRFSPPLLRSFKRVEHEVLGSVGVEHFSFSLAIGNRELKVDFILHVCLQKLAGHTPAVA